MTEHIEQYLLSLRARNYSRHTLRAYTTDLSEFVQFIESRPITLQEIARFTSLLHSRGLDRVSIIRHMASLKSFLLWMEAEELMPGDLTSSLVRGKSPKRLQDVPSVEEVFHLLDGGIPSARPKRDGAILELLYATGVRVQELCGINEDDLEGDDTIIIRGKGDKERRVFYGQPARKALLKWMEQRSEILKRSEHKTPALFFSTGPNAGRMRLDQRTIVRIIKFVAQAKGFNPEKWYPHIMRHAFACHCLDNAMPLEVISTLLGHAKLSTTVTYTQVATSRMLEAYSEFHPHGKKKQARVEGTDSKDDPKKERA